MTDRFNQTLVLASNTFQYLQTLYVRWKIYRVYISPVIEWFLPVAAMEKGVEESSSANAVEVYQQKMLAMVASITSSVNRDGLNDIMRERPTALKMMLLAQKHSKYLDPRDPEKLRWGKQGPVEPSTVTLRSNKVLQDTRWKGLERGDLGDRLTYLALKLEEVPDERLGAYVNGHPNFIKFDSKTAQAWIENEGKRISRKQKQRAHCVAFGIDMDDLINF